MQATLIGTSEDCRHLEQLLDAERYLIDMVAATRETIVRCEQALDLLAGIRRHLTDEQASRRAPAPCHVSLRQPQQCSNSQRVSEHADRLTAREHEVLRLIAAGESNRQIAETLYLSPRTIERHIANIYLKIDVHSKTEATSYAARHNLA